MEINRNTLNIIRNGLIKIDSIYIDREGNQSNVYDRCVFYDNISSDIKIDKDISLTYYAYKKFHIGDYIFNLIDSGLVSNRMIIECNNDELKYSVIYYVSVNKICRSIDELIYKYDIDVYDPIFISKSSIQVERDNKLKNILE